MSAPYTPPPAPSPFVAPSPAADNRSWISRHWLACLGCGCFTVAGLGVAAVVAIVFFAMAALKQSDVYKESFHIISTSPQVEAELGAPISGGWWVSGSVNVQNGSGEADLRYSVSGPKGEGIVETAAIRRSGVWHLSSLTLEKSGQRIDLLAPDGSGQ